MVLVMTQRASTCLSLLALLSSFPVSLGDATQIGGSSLIGVSTVSETLDNFFKRQETSGKKPPIWKKEAQAMISLIQRMKADPAPGNHIDETTQVEIDEKVKDIIGLLDGDLEIVKGEQPSQKGLLDALKSTQTTEFGELDTQLQKVKTESAASKTCRENVTTQHTTFYVTEACTDNDRTGGSSLLELGSGGCPTECGKPSTAEFELTSAAKQTYTCDFEAGETAKECVARLWGKVNQTRANLTNKYNAWAEKKRRCEEHMERCAKCNPLWDTMTATIEMCDRKRDVVYDAYCKLQRDEIDFCGANDTVYTQWNTVFKPEQDERVMEHSDLDFIKCIFEKYLEIHDFTVTMINECPKKGAAEYYSIAGEALTAPGLDASDVPQCFGAVSHSSGSTLWDMTGLINEFTTDGHGTTVSVSDHMYTPDASPSSFACTALTR